MVQQTYSVTLDSDIVDEAKVLCQDYGGKLSPLLNNLLGKWLEAKKKQTKGKIPPKSKAAKSEKKSDDLFSDINLLGDEAALK